MNIFHKMQDSILTVLKYILLVIFLLVVAFIIKWRIDNINQVAKKNVNVSLSIKDEINILKKQYISLTEKEGVNLELPKVELTEDPLDNTITVEIKDGENLDEIGETLKNLDLIKDVNTFKKICYDMAIENSFKAGSYKIEKRETVRETLLEIVGISPKTCEITVTEEMGARDVADLLKEREVIQDTDAFVDAADKMGKLEDFKPGKYEINLPLRVSKMIEILTTEPSKN